MSLQKNLHSFLMLFCLLVNAQSCTPSGPSSADSLLRFGIPISDFNPEFNPYTDTSAAEGMLSELLYSTLLNMEKMDWSPHLAKSLQIDATRTVISVILKPHVKFHDGTLLTASDVAYSFEAARKSPDNFYSTLLTSLNSIQVVSENEIRFSLVRPDNFFLHSLKLLPISKRPASGQGRKQQIGTGPYRFISYNEQKHILNLVAHNDYFEGAPHFKSLEIHFQPNQTTGMADILTGKIDMTYLPDPTYENLFQSSMRYSMAYQAVPFYYMMDFNPYSPRVADKNIRLALNLAIPRDKILATLKGITQEVGIIRSFTQHNADSNLAYPYDPEQAEKLLNASGWHRVRGHFVDKSGHPLTLKIVSLAEQELHTLILMHVQRALTQFGIEVEAQLMPLSEILKRPADSQDPDLTFIGLNMNFPEIFTYSFWHQSSPTRKRPSPLGDAIDQSLSNLRFSVSPDLENRDLFFSFEKTFADDPPALLLFWRKLPVILRKDIRNIPDYPFLDISLHLHELSRENLEQGN